MSFESGSTSFRMFYLPRPLPEDFVERFQAKAAPPISTLGNTPIRGWVTGRHDLDRMIDADSVQLAGYIRMTLMTAERKVSESLLRAEISIEELARMKAEGRSSLDRHTRAEIRKDIHDRLQSSAQPRIKGIPIVHSPGSDVLFAGVTTDRQEDALEAHFRETMGFGLTPADPVHSAFKRLRLDIRDIRPVSFSPDCDDDSMTGTHGFDFLTWLLYFSEARGGIANIADVQWGLLLEGPLVFVREGGSAEQMAVRNGTPQISAEVKVALLAGKKLGRARVYLARGDERFCVTVLADNFIFRSLTQPETYALTPADRFQSRMTNINAFVSVFYGLYDQYLKERTGEKWLDVQSDIHRWVSERRGVK